MISNDSETYRNRSRVSKLVIDMISVVHKGPVVENDAVGHILEAFALETRFGCRYGYNFDAKESPTGFEKCANRSDVSTLVKVHRISIRKKVWIAVKLAHRKLAETQANFGSKRQLCSCSWCDFDRKATFTGVVEGPNRTGVSTLVRVHRTTGSPWSKRSKWQRKHAAESWLKSQSKLAF